MPSGNDRHEATSDTKRRVGWWRLAVVAIVLVPSAVAVALIDSKPLVIEVEELTSERATQARGLVSRIRSEFILATDQPTEFVITEDEVNGLAALARRAIPRVAARVNMTRWVALGALTVRIPSTPFGSYINLLVEVAPSSTGLEISKVRIGSIRIPAPMVLPIMRLVLDALLGWGNGSALLTTIAEVSPEEDQVTVHFRAMPDFASRMSAVRDRFRLAREEAIRVSDPALVSVYYRQIEELASSADPQDQISLERYMAPVFELAARRSRTSSAIEENRAAIMALAVFFGSQRFELFTGPVIPLRGPRRESRESRATLADRVDLRLHFIYSAALKLASDSGISFALGEFKELLDAGEGGSGFSFADLAADRSGIRFAEEAIASETRAARLQQLVAAGNGESLFFPSLQGLPEGLAEADFQQAYSGVDSLEYRAAVAEIDRRLDDLPVYR